MTKAELVNQIAMETGYDKTTILNIVRCQTPYDRQDTRISTTVLPHIVSHRR